MLQHYWNLTIRLFSIISGTLIGGEGLTCCRICEVVHASTQLWSKQNCQRRIPLEEKEDCLSNIWLCTYGYIIAWAVTSDCAHTGISFHGYYGSKYYYYSTPICREAVGVFHSFSWLGYACDFQASQMKCYLIQELMAQFELVKHINPEAAKNLCCAKGEGTVDHSNQM